MKLIEQYFHLIERGNPSPLMAESSPFTIHEDRANPFSWLLNEYLQRTNDGKRYLTIMFEDAVRYGKIMTIKEADEITQTMEIMEINNERVYANPSDPHWSEETYLINQLALCQPNFTEEEKVAYQEMYDEYFTAISQLN